MRSNGGSYDADGVERDALGRKLPTRFNLVSLNRAVPGLIDQFSKVVPDWFTKPCTERTNDGRAMTEIKCPCGESPRVVVGAMKLCTCQRHYAHLGSRILVTGGPNIAKS